MSTATMPTTAAKDTAPARFIGGRRATTRDGRAEGKAAIASSTGAPVDLATLVAAARAEVNEGWTPMEAARMILGRMEPDDDARRTLLASGLANALNTVVGHVRRTARSVAEILPPESPPREDPLSIPAQTSDGRMAQFLDWTVADWRAWETYCEKQADGWARRQDGSREIAKLITKHGVGRTRDLPPEALDKVRAIVRGF